MPDGDLFGDIFKLILRAEQNESESRDFDIDNWATEFEQCFPKYLKINPDFRSAETPYWGLPYGERPRLYEMNPEADAINTEGYRAIEFFPNRDIKDESYILMGTPSEIRIQLMILMNMKRMLSGSEGWIGFPFHEWVKASPGGISAQIILLPNKLGVNYAADPYWSKRQISIPSPDRAKLTYDAIRTACGGEQGLNWGEWQARVYLIDPDRGSQHQMVAGGTSQANAKANLDRFLPFTKCEAKNFTYNQLDYNRGERAKDPIRAKRQSLDVFPAWLWVFNREALPVETPGTNGLPTHKGRLQARRFKLDIRANKAPTGWAEKLKDAFRNHLGQLVD